MRKETRNLIFIFLFAFGLRIIFSLFVTVRWWDETVYLSLAKDLSSNFFNYSLSGAGWSDYIPFGSFPYSWPNIGFRAPLLPYSLSFFNLVNLPFLTELFVPFVGSLSSIGVYFLGKKMFNSRVGLYSAIIFSLIPLHIFWSGRISTGIYGLFFLIWTFLFFWKGFEENNNNSKILFGIFLSLAVLSRYTILWIIPVFLIYFLIRDKNLKILKDKYLWFSILAFFGVMIPWFIYGISAYGNPLGAFIHGTIGAGFWGGVQSLFFYFQQFPSIFSWSIFLIFVFALVYIIYFKKLSDKRIYLLFVWFLFFLFVASFVPHKEERFLLPLLVPVCILSGFFLSKIRFSKSNLAKIIVAFLILGYLIGFYFFFRGYYNSENSGTNLCFYEGMEFIESLPNNSLVYSDEPPIVYFYTGKNIKYYPNPFNLSLILGDGFIIYTDYDMPLYLDKNVRIRESLQDNLELIFSCNKEWGITEIYKL